MILPLCRGYVKAFSGDFCEFGASLRRFAEGRLGEVIAGTNCVRLFPCMVSSLIFVGIPRHGGINPKPIVTSEILCYNEEKLQNEEEQPMFKTGVVSVTFRKLAAEKILTLASEARLTGIEWGGDIHVPHGDMDAALDVKFLTDEASLDNISYGSYYKMTGSHEEWNEVLMCAESLCVPNVRVWAGNKGSADTSPSERKRIIAEAQMIADMLEFDGGTSISFEYHSGTLTDTPESAVELVKSIDRGNVKLYWQPNQFRSHEDNLKGLDLVMPYLSNVHLFAWEGHEKFMLEHHRQRWIEYLDRIKLYNEKSECALIMEFVKDDSPEQFKRDAEELHNIIRLVG